MEVKTYIEMVQDDRHEMMNQLVDLIYCLYPTVERRISFRIPMFFLGKGWVYVNYWKQGVSMHVGIIPALDEFRVRHPEFKTGKGCINFKLKDAIPREDVLILIKAAMERGRKAVEP